MSDSDCDIQIGAPVAAVWAVLSDIHAYPEWNRYTPVSWDDEAKGLITVAVTSVTRTGSPHRFQMPGRIHLREPDEMSLSLGVPGLVRITIVYNLSPHLGGTRVEVRIGSSGLAGIFLRRRFKGVYRKPVQAALEDLRRRCDAGDRQSRRPATSKTLRVEKSNLRRRFR